MRARTREMAARLAPDVGAPKAVAVLEALTAPSKGAATGSEVR